ADAVVSVTHRHTQMLRQVYHHLKPEKFHTIPNGYDEAEWRQWTRGHLDQDTTRQRQFRVVYAGSLEDDRDPAPVFAAAHRLLECRVIDPAHLRFDFIGRCEVAGGRPLLSVAAACGVATYVHLSGFTTKAKTFSHLAESDLALLLAEGWP